MVLMNHRSSTPWRLCAAFICAATLAHAESTFPSAIRLDDVDVSACAQSVDGTEAPLDPKSPVTDILWTNKPSTGRGLSFGNSKTVAPRHVRIAFKRPVLIGSVLVQGGGHLSVLKPGADSAALNDELAWLPAERPGGNTPVAEGGFGVWILPPQTETRALRFTHTPVATDKTYAGRIGGLLALKERLANVAPQAIASASGNAHKANLLVDEDDNSTWKTWDNWEETSPPLPVSAEHPVFITLVWPRAVRLSALAMLWTGFSVAEVQALSGPEDRHPSEASEADWKAVVSSSQLEHFYARTLRPQWLAFPSEVSTRAVRLRITGAASENHDHLRGKTQQGRRIWLGELMALQTLGSSPIGSAVLPAVKEETHPPIPIRFTLAEPGLVTLVIEDRAGHRIRNLVAETPFPAGENTTWWDGLDDLGRDHEAAEHGLYHIPGKFVSPGEYRVRGLTFPGTELRYEFAVYNEGNPPWETEDKTGCWMTNHTPPTSMLFVPGHKNPDGQSLIFMGAMVPEGGHGLQWLDMSGKKRGGFGSVGGAWTGAPTLACDLGKEAVPDVQCYVGSIREGELRLNSIVNGAVKEVLKTQLGSDPKDATAPELAGFDGGKKTFVLAGLAAHNGRLVCSMPRQNELLFVDARTGKLTARASVPNPRGLAFDPEGRLLVLSGDKLRRYNLSSSPDKPLDAGITLPLSGLEDPRHIITNTAGHFLISDRGGSHQVKVFSADGKLSATFGKAGPPKAGPYDPLHMNNPNGLALDDQGRLWVAEADRQPKRVSVWTVADGKLARAYYGPGRYGGGGKLDPRDKTRFYYEGMEFRLDWEKGTSTLVNVLFRQGPGDLTLPGSHPSDGNPEEPIYLSTAFASSPGRPALRRYFTNCYNSSPTGGAPVSFLWLDREGIARPVAAAGRASEWDILQQPGFASRWPKDVDPKGDARKNAAFFFWNDKNASATPESDEITILKATSGGVTVMPDLSFLISRLDGCAVRFAPRSFTAAGVPLYDPAARGVLAQGVQPPMSSGGDQALLHPSGWTLLTAVPQPFDRASICGALKGEPRWSYPSPWPGLHASHEAPIGEPGQLIGTTRLLGNVVQPTKGESGPLCFINGNMGTIYVFTIDGLFVRTLFQDVRAGRPWRMPTAERNMLLNDVAPHDENFWPSVTQTEDGRIYLVDGARTSLVRVDGLDGIRRLPEQTLKVTAADLQRAQTDQIEREASRQRAQGTFTLQVPIRPAAPSVDGQLGDWPSVQWVPIDRRGVKANFNSDSKPYEVDGALMVSGERLYAAFRTGDALLLRNSGELPQAPFKTGGALDVMLGTNPSADPKRASPAPGDLRLLVTLIKNQPRAFLFRAVVPGTAAGKRIPFSSPARTIYFDQVQDVTGDIQFAAAGGNFEFSIPLATVGLKPAPDLVLRGDLGLLRGDGTATTQRVYWSNKATGITADVPSEAQLTPHLWGHLQFVR